MPSNPLRIATGAATAGFLLLLAHMCTGVGLRRRAELQLFPRAPSDVSTPHLAVGDTLGVTPTVCFFRGDSGACDVVTASHGTLSWASSDSSILSVDAQGRLSARHPGRARITARIQPKRHNSLSGPEWVRDYDSLSVVVIPEIRSLTWEPVTRRIRVGDTLRLAAVARDASGRAVASVPLMGVINPPLDWDIGDWDDPRGVLITPKGPGTVTLRAAVGHRAAVAVLEAVTP